MQHVPPESSEPRSAADELLVHGLLSHMHADSPDSRDVRVRRVMVEIAGSADSFTLRRDKPRSAWRRRALGLAACLAISSGLLFFGLPAEPTALAQTQRALSQLRTGGDRRYEVRAVDVDRPGADRSDVDDGAAPIGIVDMRAPNKMLIRAVLPDGRPIVVGRDAKGPWNLRPDGHVDRTDYERGWPRWADVDGQPLLADSVDQLLESVTRGYDLERRPADATAPDGSPLDRIIARRSVPPTPLHDNRPSDGPGLSGGTDGPGGPGAHDVDAGPPGPPPMDQDQPDEGPSRPTADLPPMPPDGPGRSGGPSPSQIDILIHAKSNTVERIELRWPDRPPRGRPNPPPGAVESREGVPRGFRDDPRGGPGVRRPRPQGPNSERPFPGPRNRSDRDDPRAPDSGPMDVMPGHPPGFPNLRPRPLRPPPPRLLIIQRAATPTLDDAWFDPLTHLSTFDR